MPRVKCGKCQAVIKLDAVPADGTIQCPDCGATFRVRTKSSESVSSESPSPESPAPIPDVPAAPSDQPDFSFAAAAAPPQPKAGGGIDLGFLAGTSAKPAEPASAEPPLPDASPDKTLPEIKPAATKPKRKSAKVAPVAFEAPPNQPVPNQPLPNQPKASEPPGFSAPQADADGGQRHSETEPPEAPASPYASPAPAIAPVDKSSAGLAAGGELLAQPAPSFMTGMFDGSFRYFLTPRIVKVFWTLALVAAGIALTLVIGGYFLMLYGVMVADAGLPEGRRYATELSSEPPMLMQFQPGPSSRGSSFTTMGKLGTVLFSTLYTLAMVTMILMWLLFLRMLLEAFCVLFGIRVSLRVMAERS